MGLPAASCLCARRAGLHPRGFLQAVWLCSRSYDHLRRNPLFIGAGLWTPCLPFPRQTRLIMPRNRGPLEGGSGNDPHRWPVLSFLLKAFRIPEPRTPGCAWPFFPGVASIRPELPGVRGARHGEPSFRDTDSVVKEPRVTSSSRSSGIPPSPGNVGPSGTPAPAGSADRSTGTPWEGTLSLPQDGVRRR